MSQESLVGISEACQILKVSETALRQWTDEGKIKAFITPGGHRRYLVADLKKFMSFHHRAIGVRDLAVEIEETAPVLRDIAVNFLIDTPWHSRLTKEAKEHLADIGRQLLHSIIRYITAPSERGETLKEAHEIGGRLGTALAGLGLPLTHSVEMFIMHREPILKVATSLMKKHEAYSGRIVDAIPLVAHVMDEALLSLVAAHQQYRNETSDNKGKGN